MTSCGTILGRPLLTPVLC